MVGVDVGVVVHVVGPQTLGRQVDIEGLEAGQMDFLHLGDGVLDGQEQERGGGACEQDEGGLEDFRQAGLLEAEKVGVGLGDRTGGEGEGL